MALSLCVFDPAFLIYRIKDSLFFLDVLSKTPIALFAALRPNVSPSKFPSRNLRSAQKPSLDLRIEVSLPSASSSLKHRTAGERVVSVVEATRTSRRCPPPVAGAHGEAVLGFKEQPAAPTRGAEPPALWTDNTGQSPVATCSDRWVAGPWLSQQPTQGAHRADLLRKPVLSGENAEWGGKN